jgi:hypothetical protein
MASTILLGGARVDVSTYLDAHPGGRDVLEAFVASGDDALQSFMDVGHSAAARREVERRAKLLDPSAAPRFPPLKRAKTFVPHLDKLMTHEDPWAIHKILGCLHLVYFWVLRLWALWAPRTFWPVASVALLLSCLSVSSLRFSVPTTAPRAAPGINQLFRAHSAIFALRGTTCSVIAAASTLSPSQRRLAKFAVVLGTCALADLFSRLLVRRDDRDWRTTRTMPYWPECTEGRRRVHVLYYTWAQFGATCMCLTCLDDSNPARAMDTLVAIQGAAFLQTLVRKGILTPYGYHLLYSAQLAHVLLVGARGNNATGLRLSAMALGATVLRLKGANKYALLVALGACDVALGVNM